MFRLRSSRHQYFFCFAVFSVIALFPAMSPAESAGPSPTSGTIVIFGENYTFSGIDLETTIFGGSGSIASLTGANGNWCGTALGFYQGASPAQDRLYLTEECNTKGEDAVYLTGATAYPDYRFTAASSSAYVADPTTAPNPEYDPYGIDWISDVETGPLADNNVRVMIDENYPPYLAGFDYDQFPIAGWTPEVDVDNSAFDYRTATASCTNAILPTAPTRLFVGGTYFDGMTKYFAYQAFDLTTNQFVNSNFIYLNALGLPNGSGSDDNRDLRALASDGTSYYVAIKKPSVAEFWLYKYSSFPDPGSSGSAAHPESSPPSCRLDGTGGLVIPDNTNRVPAGSARPDRMGMACGRMVYVTGMQTRPIFYILCEHFLYTLVPQDIIPGPAPTATPPPPAGIDGAVRQYR